MPNIKRTSSEKTNIVPVQFDAFFFFERGVRSLSRNDVSKALRYFYKCVDLDPTNPKYLTHLAAVYTEMEEYEESNRLLASIVHDIDERMTDCYYYMANNMAHMGDFDQAEQYALMYLQEDPNGLYAEEVEELIDFICYELDRTPKDLDVEHKLIGKHEKARHCLEEGKFVEATKRLEEMVEEYPDFLAARNNLALSYYYMGHFEKAMEVIDDILEKDQANLHALCNLAIFCSHKGMEDQICELVEGLKKILPLHHDQYFKLATTLGILGEDERAYELFMTLVKRGIGEDESLYHYVAVAAFNTKRWAHAEQYWRKIKEMASEEIADYYLNLLKDPSVDKEEHRLPYHYQLPYDVQFKKKNWFSEGVAPKTILKDPLVRSSLFWSLRHGDRETKLQVIQSFEYLADHEVEEALRQIIIEQEEDEEVKKAAISVLRQIGARLPYYAFLEGEVISVDNEWITESIFLDSIPQSNYDDNKRK